MAKILLIEDMQGVRDSLEMVLEVCGHTVDCAINGEEGLSKLAAGQYDLVITDILMPIKDGTEVIMEAKQSHPNLPILAISGGGNGIGAEQALTLAAQKADDILTKPFSKDDIVNKINNMLS